MTTGIYTIKHIAPGKLYVGSGVSVENRWSVHKASLKAGDHFNSRLQNAWNKYGPSAFEFSIIEECSKEQLIDTEQKWLDDLEAVAKGYNIQPKARSPIGVVVSLATRKKISLAAKRIGANPKERKRRSIRAKKQHNQGKLGQTTWTEESQSRANVKIKKYAQENAETTGQRFRDYWSDDSNRQRQSRKLSKFASSNSEEMARRAKVYWDNVPTEERKLRAADILEKRKVKHAKSMRIWADKRRQERAHSIPEGHFF